MNWADEDEEKTYFRKANGTSRGRWWMEHSNKTSEQNEHMERADDNSKWSIQMKRANETSKWNEKKIDALFSKRLISFPWAREWVSERASERMSAADQANEWTMRANERADERMTECSTCRFRIISTQSALIWDFFVSVVEEIRFLTIWGWQSFPLKPDVKKEIDE